MVIQGMLTVWLLALIFFTNRFRREGRIFQQRLFSVFLIIWAVLGVIYYDVWTITSGQMETAAAQSWETYLPSTFFSICAGLGVYYLMMTFGKFRAADEKNQKEAEKEYAAKQAKKKAAKEQKANKKKK